MAHMHLLIDAANVVGCRPDGWWRDRAGAAARLVAQVAGALAAGRMGGPVTVVVEGAARDGATEGAVLQQPALRIVHAARDGDSAILALVVSLVVEDPAVGVVTADRALQALVTAAGAQVFRPGWLLEQL
jgi:hypothetical protein